MDEVRRTFTDESDRKWIAERIGRTSGIVAPHKDMELPGPADILRFVCASDPSESIRESTIRAGALGDMQEEELQSVLKSARILPNAPG